MDKKKELAKNTFIIFIGRFCTQFVTFLLIPIYTRYLLTSDYGYVDLVQSYVSLLVPIIILRFDSAIFRFLIDYREKNTKRKIEIISSSFFLIFLQMIAVTFVLILINSYFHFSYWLAIVLNVIFVSFSSYLLQLVRGIGKNIDYSIASIISAVITIVLNVVMLIALKYDGSSILYASAVANIFCSLYLVFKNNLYRYIKIESFNKNTLKEMLRYSIPMIPDGLSWWIVNVSDRTIISFLIGTSANGIYAISSKFSNILSSIFQIFNMSWQESASLHINDSDRDDFFTDILNKSYLFFYSACIFILVCMPFVFSLFIGEKFWTAYVYIPILLLGNLYNALGNITGGVYIAVKQTKQVAKTTIIAAFINIIINLSLIKLFGLYAAAFSTLLSYIVLALYRYIDVKKYVNMRLNLKTLFLTNILFLISSLIYFLNNFILNILNLILITIVISILNRSYIHFLIYKLKKKMI
jgi:O-antigen/teichoic acid export membrane protein